MKVCLLNQILILILFGTQVLDAQDIAFKGGVGDGFSATELNDEFLDFTKGANGDGFTGSESLSTESIFTIGGNGDGYSSIEFDQQFLDFTKGGNGDGFDSKFINQDYNVMYVGDIGDGFAKIESANGFNDIYTGGQSDGFAYNKYGHTIFWTGLVSTGWDVAGNWANGIIPSFCNPVVIPSDVPNFPAVNAGVLRIGYYKNEGEYKCQSLKINAGAEMLTRVNCFVENYELICIQGKLFVKNPASHAIMNLWDGLIQLKANAEMIVKE